VTADRQKAYIDIRASNLLGDGHGVAQGLLAGDAKECMRD